MAIAAAMAATVATGSTAIASTSGSSNSGNGMNEYEPTINIDRSGEVKRKLRKG